MKNRSITLKKIGLALASLGAMAISGSVLAAMQVSTEGGLRVWDPENEAYWFRVGGRLEFDEVFYSGSWRDRRRNFASSGNIRRGYLALGGGVGCDWIYNLTLDFGRTFHRRNLADRHRVHHGVTIIEDAWLGYTGLWDCTRVRFGQFTPLTTLDGWGNYGINNGQMFLESALGTRAFDVPSYVNTSSTSMKGFGVILETELADMITFGATIYQPAHGPENNYGNRAKSDRVGGAVRITFVPMHEEGCVQHFGVLGRVQDLNHWNGRFFPFNGVYNQLFFTTPEVVSRNYIGVFESSNAGLTGIPVHDTHGSPVVLDAGPLRAKSYNHIAGEYAGIWGPITVAAEYHYATVIRFPREPLSNANATAVWGSPQNILDRGNLHFHAWHVQAGYVLTGESRGYDFARGAFDGIEPCCDWGAWEVTTRYSSLSLNSGNVYGGTGRNWTIGLNWFVNCHVRFMFNYIRADLKPTFHARVGQQPPTGTEIKRRLDIFGLRAQVVF